MTTHELDAEFETLDLNINMGPVHPATHGVFRAVLSIDGELVVDVEPVIGYMPSAAGDARRRLASYLLNGSC